MEKLIKNRSPELIMTASNWMTFIALIVLYFIPTIAAHKHRQSSAIFILNLLLGWTVIGWILALVWAATKTDKPTN